MTSSHDYTNTQFPTLTSSEASIPSTWPEEHSERARASATPRASSKVSSPASYAAKPLARAVLVCKRCRSKKIKCDQVFPACGSCVKASEPCVGIDSATGREVSRSYIVDLELQVQELRQQNTELERRLLNVDTMTNSRQKRPLDTLKAENQTEEDDQVSQIEGPLHKRCLIDATLDPAGVEATTSATIPKSIPAFRPLLGRLNSRASGLSPARLLCQAIQQSAQAGLRLNNPGSTSQLRPASSNRPMKDKPSMRYNHCLPPKSPGASAEQHRHSNLDTRGLRDKVRAEVRTDSSSSGSATPLEGRRNSPYDDGDVMQYANTTETGDITVPAPEQLLKPSPLPAPFPPLSIARKLVDAYFERVNPQLPILERSTFMPRFERACQVGLDKAKAELSSVARQQAQDNADHVEIEPQPADGHLFHLVFAIAAAMGWTRSKWSAENHHEAAMRFLDPRRHTAAGPDSSVGAIMGRDALEQLQCLLLTALYSIMRPMKPGVWYCLGVALRLTTGLGLYSESPGLLEKSDLDLASDAVESLLEKKRRLFWCSYALDRQVCVHLGRPFGIADSDVKVGLPWVDSEGFNGPAHSTIFDDNSGAADEQRADSSTEIARREAASTLAGLQSTADKRQRSSTITRPKDASRWISLSFFRMRILQSELQSILYQNAELPRRFQTYQQWKGDVLDRLRSWRRFAPSDKEELEASGCGYNPIFLELNYQQTLLMVYGLSPRFSNASRNDLACVEECSRSIIKMYATLSKEGQMNYTWMTGHNVFLACTSYLYAIWQINATDPASFQSTMTPGFTNKVEEIQHFASACDKVLASLQWATAEKCRKCLKAMFYATSMVVDKLDRSSASRNGSRTSKSTKTRSDTTTEFALHAPPSDFPAKQVRLATKALVDDSAAEKPHLFSVPEQTWRADDVKTNRSPASATTSQMRGWSDRGRQTYQNDPSQSIESASEHSYRNRTASAGFRPDVHNLINMAESHKHDSTTSRDIYGNEGTAPSLEFGISSAMADVSCAASGWSEPEAHPSPRSFLPDSPSNFDISSMMAASAMELDALFREAGLSAGPGGHGPAANTFSSSDLGQREWLSNQTEIAPLIDNLQVPIAQHHGLGASLHGDVHTSLPSYVTSNDIDTGVATQSSRPSRAAGDGFDTDWEALGFGYRPGENTDPLANQTWVTRQAPDSEASRAEIGPTTEFDYRFLDSHMGF